MTDEAKRLARQNAVRGRDADRLEASLGELPAAVERPWLVILVGLPGSGKSHFARALAQRAPAAILDSDALRGVLFAEPQHTQQEHGRLFPALHVIIDRLLGRGIPVIVDATNLKASMRRPYSKIAEAHGAKEVLVRVTAPVRVIRERLARRSTDRDADDRSTADAEVYAKMLADVEPIPQRHVRVDTSRDVEAALDKVAALLQS